MDEKLIRYIKENIERGHHPEKIKDILVKAGHDSKIVDEHIRHIHRKKKMPLFLTTAFAAIIICIGLYYFSIQGDDNEVPAAGIEIQRGSYQDFASIINEALVRNDLSLCEQIFDAKIKDECKLGFSKQNMQCDAECKDKQALNRALIGHNSTICREINSLDLRNQCTSAIK